MKNTFKKSLKTNTLISPVTNSSPNYLLSAIFLPISPDDIISHYEPQSEWSNSLFTASRITTHISCHHLTQIYARFSTTMVISIGKLLLNFIIPHKSTIKFLRYNIAVSKKLRWIMIHWLIIICLCFIKWNILLTVKHWYAWRL